MQTESVSVVVPGYNCGRTIGPCLTAIVALLESEDSAVEEIIFVDDGSTDDTARIVAAFPVTYLLGKGMGPGSARNMGWRAAGNELIWFVDSDCVAEPDALDRLLPHLDDSRVGGVGGSYGIMNPESLLARLIHEEIMERHRRMGTTVNFLGGFNVLYRRSVLEEVEGFDEKWVNGPGKPGAEDAELAYAVRNAGHALHFEPASIVRHFHPTDLPGYLRSQRIHGFWRVRLHLIHRGHFAGDSYSRISDHLQPPLALLLLVSLPLALGSAPWVPLAEALGLIALQAPMTVRLVLRTRNGRYLLFGALSLVRSFWRGAGMLEAIPAFLRNLKRRPENDVRVRMR